LRVPFRDLVNREFCVFEQCGQFLAGSKTRVRRWERNMLVKELAEQGIKMLPDFLQHGHAENPAKTAL